MLAPMLANSASGGRPGGASPGFSRRGELSQIPERSGLPSAARGMGAATFTLPSGPFGTPCTVARGHCADNVSEEATAIAAATSVVVNPFMCASGGLDRAPQLPPPNYLTTQLPNYQVRGHC